MTNKKLDSIAYHEAGHAVAARRVGCRIKKVSIVPDEDSDGRMTHGPYFKGFHPDWDNSSRVQRRLENMAFVCLAGPAAQRRFNPHGYRHQHAGQDHHDAMNLLGYMVGSDEELEAYLRLTEVRVTNFVRNPHTWMAIEAVAAALLEREVLTGKATREVIMALNQRLLAEAYPRGVPFQTHESGS